MKRVKLIILAFMATLTALLGSRVLAESYTISVNGDSTGHTYEAYQIFKGDLSGDTLSNIQWGSGVNSFEYNGSNVAATIADGLNDSNAADFATKAAANLTVPSGEGSSSITVAAAGYYLIKDKDNSQDGKNSAYTSFVLKVVKNTDFTPKSDKPTVLKKVKDINDSTDTEKSNWQDSADYDINDDVPFQLTATLPSNYDSYKEYYLNLKDTLSTGLTYNKDAKVYVVNGENKTDVTSSFTISNDGSSYKINNLKSVTTAAITKTSKIVVEYTAKLNENAVLGSTGNPNEVSLEYSNNPNFDGNGENSPKGETPKDKVIVFTYQAVINKLNESKAPLSGAEFTLYKKIADGSQKEISAVKDSTGTKFSFKGLDDGTYVLKETKTPSGYNTIDDITFSIVSDHSKEADEPQLISLSGEKLSGTVTFKSDNEAGSLTADVINKKGSILPSTGSVGTKMFYIIGSAIVVLACMFIFFGKRKEVKK